MQQASSVQVSGKKEASLNDQEDLLLCGICLRFVSRADEATCCNNLYCYSCCPEDARTCPTCNSDKFKTKRYVEHLRIKEKPISCPFFCGTTIETGNLKAHKNVCPNKIFTCSLESCSFRGGRNNYTEHILKNHANEVSSAFMKRENENTIKAHRDLCPSKVCKCNIQEFKFEAGMDAFISYISETSLDDIITVFDESVNLAIESYLENNIEALWKRKFEKKSAVSGKVRGYYRRSIIRHPIVGTYKIDGLRLIMNTTDNAGSAEWFGKISLNGLSIKIKKIYEDGSAIWIDGNFNKKLNELEGTWRSWLIFPGGLKLIFIEDKPLLTC